MDYLEVDASIIHDSPCVRKSYGLQQPCIGRLAVEVWKADLFVEVAVHCVANLPHLVLHVPAHRVANGAVELILRGLLY